MNSLRMLIVSGLLSFTLIAEAQTMIKVYDGIEQKYRDVEVIELSEEQWKQKLSSEEFKILRKEGTEHAFTSELNKNKAKGIYICAACKNHLFTSKAKFESGTGWPSYYEPIAPENVGTEEDNRLFMRRTEVHCARCGGHLGHVFEDGPEPTGLRYCINGAALDFMPMDEAK